VSGSWLADLVLHGLSEPSGVQEASGDIVIQVGEAQGDASQVCFVKFGRAVGGGDVLLDSGVLVL